MHLCFCVVNRSQSPPVRNGQAHQITAFFKVFWVAKGRCVLLRSTVTLSALSKGLVKQHGYNGYIVDSIQYDSITYRFRFSSSRTRACLQKQVHFASWNRWQWDCDGNLLIAILGLRTRTCALCHPNCPQLATSLHLFSVSIYGYTTNMNWYLNISQYEVA